MIRLKILAILAIFFAGSITGWVVELFFRRYIGKDRKWLNPGYLTGPYLPIYGFGISFLFIISYFVEQMNLNYITHIIFIFVISAFFMTMLELIGGLFFLKYANIRLWDYSGLKGNYKGVICPLFTFIWGVSSLLYYFFINPLCIKGLDFLFNNLDMSFFVGLFAGFFIVDLWITASITTKLRLLSTQAKESLRYDNFKLHIAQTRNKIDNKIHFFIRPYETYIETSFKDYIEKMKEKHK